MSYTAAQSCRRRHSSAARRYRRCRLLSPHHTMTSMLPSMLHITSPAGDAIFDAAPCRRVAATLKTMFQMLYDYRLFVFAVDTPSRGGGAKCSSLYARILMLAYVHEADSSSGAARERGYEVRSAVQCGWLCGVRGVRDMQTITSDAQFHPHPPASADVLMSRCAFAAKKSTRRRAST